MNIPDSIFQIQPKLRWNLALQILIWPVIVVETVLVFGDSVLLVPGMLLRSMTRVVGSGDWRLLYVWFVGLIVAGGWLVLRTAHLAGLL